jgi:xanthine dehydrogenase YagR molybdenum-binding subunit
MNLEDIGTGTYTIPAHLVSAKSGVRLDRIQVLLGDTSLPPGPISGGSMVTSSVIPAVSAAAEQAVSTLLYTVSQVRGSPFAGKEFTELALSNGKIHDKNSNPESGVPYDAVLRQINVGEAIGTGKSGATLFNPDFKPTHSTHSFGAHFVEITWDPHVARLRVSRVVSVIDPGESSIRSRLETKLKGRLSWVSAWHYLKKLTMIRRPAPRLTVTWPIIPWP